MRKTYIDEAGNSITTIELTDLGELTDGQRSMLERARTKPVSYDEDSPPMPDQMMMDMERSLVS